MKTQLQKAQKLYNEALRSHKAASVAEAGGYPARALEIAYGADLLNGSADELMSNVPACEIVAGEVVPTEEERPDGKGGWQIRNTLASPDAAAIAASLDRTELLSQSHVDVLALGVDAAQSTDGNSLEKMLTHQLALAHKAAFKLTDRAMGERDTVEVARLVNAAARMLNTYQQGLLALHRLRTGGNQVVTVQHVHVGEGAQAVIGNVQTGGGKRRGGKSKNG